MARDGWKVYLPARFTVSSSPPAFPKEDVDTLLVCLVSKINLDSKLKAVVSSDHIHM